MSSIKYCLNYDSDSNGILIYEGVHFLFDMHRICIDWLQIKLNYIPRFQKHLQWKGTPAVKYFRMHTPLYYSLLRPDYGTVAMPRILFSPCRHFHFAYYSWIKSSYQLLCVCLFYSDIEYKDLQLSQEQLRARPVLSYKSSHSPPQDIRKQFKAKTSRVKTKPKVSPYPQVHHLLLLNTNLKKCHSWCC